MYLVCELEDPGKCRVEIVNVTLLACLLQTLDERAQSQTRSCCSSIAARNQLLAGASGCGALGCTGAVRVDFDLAMIAST